MPVYTWNGITVDTSLLPNYGFNEQISDGSGGTGPRFTSFLKAGIEQAALNVTAAATGLTGTSTTSATIAAGAQTLTTQTGKSFTAGMFVIAFSTSAPTNFIAGTLTSYNSGTGALALTVLNSDLGGSGTYTDWTIALAGRRGLQGLTGLSYTFSTTTTAGDPGSGLIRANNATISSTTALYVDYLDSFGRDVSAVLAQMGASSSAVEGQIIIRLQTDLSQEAFFNVTSVTDSTGYYTLAVTYVGPVTSPTWAASAPLMLHFTRTGDQGSLGYPGQAYRWDTATAAADPGSGNVRFDNATLTSATAAYIDILDVDANDVSAWLATLNTSTGTTKGILRVQSRAAANKWAEFSVTAAVNSTGYYTLTVAYLSPASPPTFTASEAVSVIFSRSGDTGAGATVFTAVNGTSTGTARPTQNFIAAGGLTIAAVDNPANTRTDITFAINGTDAIPQFLIMNQGF